MQLVNDAICETEQEARQKGLCGQAGKTGLIGKRAVDEKTEQAK
jgi:hypothetical protein